MFGLYKEGIFAEKGLIDLKEKHKNLVESSMLVEIDTDSSEESERKSSNKKFSDKTLNDKGISWMDMNHSVVIIGWGVDKSSDTKYWIVRNSYGQKWGMDGDFFVKRGNNDFGMEVE